MIINSKVKLRKERLADARDNYSWQTDPELARLDAAPLLTITLAEYLVDYADELYYSPLANHRFAIETLDGKHIGNCVYYNVDETEGEAELGIMIGNRDYWGKGYGTDAVTTLVGHIFRQTKLKRIHLKTLESNIRAQRCFEKCGFSKYGHSVTNGFQFVLMEITRKQWEEKQIKVET